MNVLSAGFVITDFYEELAWTKKCRSVSKYDRLAQAGFPTSKAANIGETDAPIERATPVTPEAAERSYSRVVFKLESEFVSGHISEASTTWARPLTQRRLAVSSGC